jgi:hypothetical protein
VPVALVIGAAAMAFVDDDEVEEVLGIVAEVGRGVAVLGRPAHEGLEDGEEQATVLGHLALLADVFRFDADQRILGEGGEGVVRLIGEDVAVGEEQDARAARRFAAQVPPAVEELPRNLESDEGLARACGQREQDAVFPSDERSQSVRLPDRVTTARRGGEGKPIGVDALELPRDLGAAGTTCRCVIE